MSSTFTLAPPAGRRSSAGKNDWTAKPRPSALLGVTPVEGVAARNAELQNYVINKIELLKRNQFHTKKITQLCSFIPDFIIMDEINRKIPYQFSCEAVVLMADISGFTALTEAYSLRGKGGTDQLTKTLAGYIGPLAECILLADGDIVKYAGDAFIAYWRSGGESYPQDVQRVVDCALYIQEKYGYYLCKEVDITIRVKIGIGAGMIHFSGIGTEVYQHYVVFGPGVKGASAAEKRCESGDIVLDPAAWAHCTPFYYRFTIKKEPFVHLHEIAMFVSEFKPGRPNASRKSRKESETPITNVDRIRPQVQIAVDKKPEAIMRPFVIPPVLRKLDDDIPVEYLNESRVVCICFIHVKYDEKVDADEKNFRDNMATIVQRAFIKIYQNVTILQGALSKVIMFDKGLTYLVVFGLPGYINENQSAHALQFSYRTRLALKAIKYVTDVSIGVTTGSCYCGVIGHPRRQEYTVIGRKVNKAARLMIYYPGKLTCDQDTAYFSKLPIDNFQLMEAKELKGIKDAGKIYEFVSADDSDDTSIPFFQYPLLGREIELAYFRNALIRTKRELEQSNTAQNMGGKAILTRVATKDASTLQKPIWMVIFEGDNGIGKSRMLSACVQEAEKINNIRVFTVGMNLASSTQAQFAISCLVVDALGMLELRTVQEREEYLRKHVSDPDLAADLCLINEILHTKFPLNPKYTALDVNAGHLLAQHVLYSLLRTTYPKDLILFVVDDAHLMDFRSWEYIVYISKFQNIFTLCSLRRSNAGSPKLPDSVSKQIYHHKNIKIIRMTGVELNMLLPLACQIMQVRGIPADLEKLIINKSGGVPAWIVQVLNELLRTGIIRLQEESFRYKQTMVFAEKIHLEKMEKRIKKHFRRWALDGNDENVKYKPSDLGDQATNVKEEEVNPMDRVLVIQSGTNIASVPVSGTLKEIVLDAFDELSPNEQILLKAATVLGTRFSRKMLTRLLPSYETDGAKKFDRCFNRLFEAKYFRCASGTAKQKEKASAINAKPECFCANNSYYKDDEGKPLDPRRKYYSCRFMEFMKENMVEVVYDIMTEDQRSELHLNAGHYLDSSLVRCEGCGGEDRSYLFGFIKAKANEYALDTDEALRLAGQSLPHSNKTMERESIRRASNASYGGDTKRKSLITQLEGLKKTFETSGSKVGHVELDILKGLIEFDHQHHHRTWKEILCCRTKAVEKDFLEEEEKIKEFELQENELYPHAEGLIQSMEVEPLTNIETPDLTPNAPNNRPSSHTPIIPLDHHVRPNIVDLRMCQCALLQARVCVEKVWHYREAKKYGRCLLNLLLASEFDITIGNGTLALIHIQDAIGLLKQIKDGEIPMPNKDDQNDNVIDEKDAEAQIEFLSGLAYFEIGMNGKARDFFLKALRRLGLVIHFDESGLRRDIAIKRAKFKLCRVRNFGCCYSVGNKKNPGTDDFQDESWPKKIRILAYLHNLFKTEKKIEMAMLVTIWQVILAEEYGDIMNDVIPAYANMIDIYGELSKHSQAKKYERMSLELLRATLCSAEQMVPIRMVTSANLFLTLAGTRLNRGEIDSSAQAAYLALRVTQSMHDNAFTVRVLPLLCQSLLHSLRVSEVAEALQKLWFLSEEADDWVGVSNYYAMCMDLILNSAYPLEQFGVCENFILNSDWTAETNLFRGFETQYSLEASLALWYSRFSRWEDAQNWFTEADNHKPKHPSYTVVNSELKLLECQLIILNHYLDSKRYQHFSKARNAVKELMRSLTKSTIVVPVLKPRFIHLLAYYYRIRSRNMESEKQLKIAEKLAAEMGNSLEQEWITHSRSVWADMAIPTIKYFWVEHTQMHTLDWHSSGKIPWANIMYSLPLPAWK